MRRGQDSLRFLQWNAGGLTQSKRTELIKILNSKKIGIFIILKANKVKKIWRDTLFLAIRFFFEKGRKIATVILVGVRNTVTSSFKIIKPMGKTNDKIETVLMNCWMSNTHFKIFSVSNPPNNKPNIDLIDINRRSIVYVTPCI